MHYVIIGNGGAGTSALQTIRHNDQNSKITVISQEKYPAYSPCSLPSLLSGEIKRPIIFRYDEKFYQRLNTNFLKNSSALMVHPKKSLIQLSDGNHVQFDKLLIAVGAMPIIPNKLPGINLDGIHIMGSLDSTMKILDHLKQGVEKVVVVGGGFIGIETAIALRKQKVNVSIVEMLPRILSRMLDDDISLKVQEILQEHDIELLLNSSVKKIMGKKGVEGVDLGKNSTYKCDMVVFAIGVRPNIKIVEKSGIKTNKGIIVNSNMQTNINNIYAAGDIVEVWDQIQKKNDIYATWPNAVEQARVAGLNMVGLATTYNGAEVVNVLDIFDTPVVAVGQTSDVMKEIKIISSFTPNTSKKIILKDNKIMGLQFVGSLKNVGTFYSIMKKGLSVNGLEERLMDENLVISPYIGTGNNI